MRKANHFTERPRTASWRNARNQLRQGQCPLWVNNGHRGELNECPLYPRKRTFAYSIASSADCYNRHLWVLPPEKPPQYTSKRNRRDIQLESRVAVSLFKDIVLSRLLTQPELPTASGAPNVTRTSLMSARALSLASTNFTFFCCSAECPLLGVKQTSVGHSEMSAFDPKRT